MKSRIFFIGCFVLLMLEINGQNIAEPTWAQDAIWYQIFVERFNNGDKTNDPTRESITVENMDIIAPKEWKISDWTSNWYQRQPWEQDSTQQFNAIIQHRRYGGDLQGVLDKLDYLQELGVTAIYFNPLNDAPSLHKYDARSYHHIDVNFGPDPDGDRKLIASEEPDNPKTWKWTSADRMFLQLVEELHNRGMKVIMDYSWNHTGTNFWAWLDVLEKQANSKYKNWYEITSFDAPNTSQNEFDYNGWGGLKYLPELKKVNIKGERIHGKPYEGNICLEVKKHIFDVSKRWLAPNGDTSKGIDGFRLDVADQIGLGFWRDYRKIVKEVKPEAILVGEIWWEKWPLVLMKPASYLQGDIFDAVMFYQVYKPARSFFLQPDDKIDAAQFRDSLLYQWNNIPKKQEYAMMNVSSSHDTPRLLSDFYNTNAYKYHANPQENPNYKTGKPDIETYQRLRLYLAHLFTTVGAPQIWNGEEMGMWGADDPNCRKPLMWKELNFDKEYRNNWQLGTKEYDELKFNEEHFKYYQKLIKIRKENPVLSHGNIDFIVAEGNKFGYSRTDDTSEILVLFNIDKDKMSFDIADDVYVDLLSGKSYQGSRIDIEPLRCVILKKE